MDMTREETTRRAGEAFGTLVQNYHYCMQRVLSKYGLYPGQPQILFHLNKMQRPTQNELAESLRITKASAGVSLRRLEKAGFVKRVRDRKDTRCIRIALTNKGVEYSRWCQIDYDMLYETMFSGFTVEKRAEILDLMQDVNDNIMELRGRLDA